MTSENHLLTNNLFTKFFNHSLIKITALSLFLVFIQFKFQSHLSFSLWDEGYLWYGVKRVLLGEVPILDFMAYDPGRYYFSALIMKIFNNNDILSLRLTLAIFQTFGLVTALYLIYSTCTKNNFFYTLICSTILILWMAPRHKLYDISICIILTAISNFLATNPTYKRFFIAGFFVSLSAYFGRNHGIYGLIGILNTCVLIKLFNIHKQNNYLSSIIYFIIGLVAGYSPLIFMLIATPHFAEAFYQSIILLVSQKATNLYLPIPWPWLVKINTADIFYSLREIFISLYFILILLFAPLIFIRLYFKKKLSPTSPALIACISLSIPYLHYALSRADVGHLAQGIFPALIGLLIIFSEFSKLRKYLLVLLILMTSYMATSLLNPQWNCRNMTCVPVKVSNDTLFVDKQTAEDINFLKSFDLEFNKEKQALFITPFWPGAYALLDLKSPVWEIYALFPRSEQFQLEEINKLKISNSKYVIVKDFALDGRDELRYKNTHPLIMDYILNNYLSLNSSKDSSLFIYEKKPK